MLPSYSPKGRKRSQQLQLWKRVALLGVVCILLLFLWVQYTILTTNLGGVPAHVGELQGATNQAAQHPDNHNEQAHLRGKEQLQQQPSEINAANHVAGGGGAGAGHDVVYEMLADEVVADVEDPDKTVTAVPSEQQEARRLAVRKAMKFAWGNYEEHAFGGDEVDPKNGWKLSNVWGDIACSLVDGIDTLWIMDLKDEFKRARDYVANQLDFSHLGRDGNKLSVFETIIREVGGLLSAFDLSGDIIFKQKAKELMDILTPAYDEKEGVFYTLFNPYTKEKSFAGWAGYRAHIADVGTLQLETRYLSDITGDPKYAEMGDAFYQILKREGSYKKTGLFPVHFNSGLGKFDTQRSVITLGALGDSFYEYLLKVYIYSGKREEDGYLRELYDDAVRGMEEHLLYFSIPDDLYFLQEMKVPSLSAVQRMDHLLCFVPGLLALGTLSETEGHAKNAKHLELAEKLMETCYQFYHRQATGLSPDIVSFPKMQVIDPKYRLRPETIESLFYLYRVTKNPKYREYGWEIFQALETHTKVKHGYAAILDVTKLPAQTENKMESFFLAETLKYHYLLQAPETLIPLDKYVFNTEAHPLRIRRRS
ncbi:Mannosyl-oligosaccharide 1,2-alpha-mannosidase [Phytophthora cactorum]|uniref:alpha-1,2-Mannosidase n=1 Tax=Phytophthora cactorum TaxID=29920 RepID=A0A329RKK6_9STRA|nr:Mannosyl-oligosaccharide 1,2-alpha-mannosidase [Phytophthora cactorum]KAG2804118.1 Mannosyl-oligosaccharide 1,2-alpha-mannosidase [Phytophthora cactorum]KAG2805380.1 Mannosyl-oligosaccharide 1,2-alpha-mannosidase [Phytophthora cactorum]KAG2842552.1 Mannosyl-oligosaccharide 1,2-alpha-mannosidase [Phytophthora cactorum]KAG2887857.1 Mannosyl-oligosaccharide 1,2-alpha-mannosidase [Phytophthora cactorum]